MTCGIYSITGDDDRIYIGGSIAIEARIRNHKSRLRRGVHSNLALLDAFNQFGWDFFTCDILMQTKENDAELLKSTEQMFIDLYKKRGYVLFNVFENSVSALGHKFGEDHKLNISFGKSGKFYECFGERHSLRDWGIIQDINWQTIQKRLNKGVPMEVALLPPEDGHNPSYLTIQGETKRIYEWAKQVGCTPHLISKRLKRGWSAKDAVFTASAASR